MTSKKLGKKDVKLKILKLERYSKKLSFYPPKSWKDLRLRNTRYNGGKEQDMKLTARGRNGKFA